MKLMQLVIIDLWNLFGANAYTFSAKFCSQSSLCWQVVWCWT